MKNFRLIIALLLWSIVIISSCKKDKSTDSPINANSYELAPNTVIIDSPTSHIIQSVDSIKIIFDGNTTQLASLTVGNIILCGIASNAPYGFMRKITAIQKVGTVSIFTTVEISLEEAFKELNVDYTKLFTTADTALRVTDTKFTFDSTTILYDEDGNKRTIDDQIKVKEKIEIAPNFRFAVKISNFKLQSAIVQGDFQTIYDQTLTVGSARFSVFDTLDFYKKLLTPFAVPGLPFLIVVPTLRVSLITQAELNGGLTASQQITSNVKTSIEYKNNNWDKNYNQTLSTTHTTPNISGNASIKVAVQPAIDFKIYNSEWAKGSVWVEGYLQAKGSLLPNPSCELKAGIGCGAKANLAFFGRDFIQAYYPNIFDYSKTLFTCLYTDFIASNTNINSGTTINFTDLTTGNPTSWSWDFPGGTPSTSNVQNPNNIKYNTPGNYYVTLIARNGDASDTLKKSQYIHVASSLNDTIQYCSPIGISPQTCSSCSGNDDNGTTGYSTRTCTVSGVKYYLKVYYVNNVPTSGLAFSSGIPIVNSTISPTAHPNPGQVTGDLCPSCPPCGSTVVILSSSVIFTGNNFSSSDSLISGYIDGNTIHLNYNSVVSVTLSPC